MLMSDVRAAAAAAPAAPVVPWLEQGSRRIPLAAFPFRIGRGSTTSLKIDSSKVSREHAEIDWRDDRLVVRDLSSTNGTFVNGQPITEADLRDGDMVCIADIEFTYCSGIANTQREAATQVLGASARKETYLDVVRGVRRLHELLSSGCIAPRFEPVVRVEDRQIVGYEALACEESLEGGGTLRQAVSESRLNLRLQQLRRLVSADYGSGLTPDAWLFMNVDPIEVGTEELVDSLVHLRFVLGEAQRLAVELPDSMISDTPLLREFRERLRREQIAMVHDGFVAGAAQVRQLQEIAPDYLKLGPAVLREALRQPERRGQLKEVIAACQELGIQVIATGVRKAEQAELCSELGCPLAQGSFFQASA
jgi:EAL domain-containing protein (putative c-di-GMP-specific phosphodiesterase class I)